jgi:hypothetical protein
LESDGGNGVPECQAGFPIPRCGVGCARTVEKITGPERDEAVESKNSQRGSRFGFVGPLALCLDTQVSAGFGNVSADGSFQLPTSALMPDSTDRSGIAAMESAMIHVPAKARICGVHDGRGWQVTQTI